MSADHDAIAAAGSRLAEATAEVQRLRAQLMDELATARINAS